MPPGPPGWGPPVPGPPNNNAAVVIVAVLVLLVAGGGAIVWKLTDGGAKGDSTITMPTVPDFPTPATGEGSQPPSFRPFSSPDTESSPGNYSSPDTYAPPPQYFGAIAVARDGSIGRSWDYSTRAAAERRALNSCPRSNCRVLTVFVNGCGAVAYNPRTNKYWGGRGDTRSAAQRNAVSNAGGGRWIAWVCTTR